MIENKVITVKNVEGEADTQTTIIYENNIDYIPKVSVIIPVYNTEKYLRKCLDSVVNQTLKEIEIICVDDGSTDNSLSILNEYKSKDKRIKLIIQKNQGAGAARNKGLELAGEYIYFLDSDDFVSLTLLENVVNKGKLTNFDICVFFNATFDNIKQEFHDCDWSNCFKLLPKKETFNKYDIPNVIFNFCNMPTFTKVYKREFLDSHNIKFQEVKTCNDVFFNLYSLALANKITTIEQTFVTYRTGHENLSKTRYQHINCIQEAFDYLKKRIKQDKIFNIVKDSFYKISKAHYDVEINLLKDNQTKKYWRKILYRNLPLKYKSSNNFFENIFSIKNQSHNNKKFKVITVIGIKIKFKVRNKGVNN